MKNLGLYIHIPFCKTKCSYCDFVSFCYGEDKQQEYLNALLLEIEFYKNKFKDKVFDSLYIGGGTPSAVFNGFIEKLSKKVFDSFNFASDTEFTIEVNPNSFNEEKLTEYLRARVNRISIGVQCLNDKVTNNIGRVQTRSAVENAFNILNKHNFTNISADIMLAMPNESNQDIVDTINFFSQNNVKHVSAYSLQVEENTPLFERVKAGESVPNDDESRRQYDLAVELLKKVGYNRYEVSNFALPGYESRHNQKYWNNTEYLGLGVSAHSFYDNFRVFNTSNLNDYIKRCKNLLNLEKKHCKTTLKSLNNLEIEKEIANNSNNKENYINKDLTINCKNKNQSKHENIANLNSHFENKLKVCSKILPIGGFEFLDENTRKTERIMLSLRTKSGLDISSFNKEFSSNFLLEHSKAIENLKKINAIILEDNYLKITDEFFYLSNAIIEEFI